MRNFVSKLRENNIRINRYHLKMILLILFIGSCSFIFIDYPKKHQGFLNCFYIEFLTFETIVHPYNKQYMKVLKVLNDLKEHKLQQETTKKSYVTIIIIYITIKRERN